MTWRPPARRTAARSARPAAGGISRLPMDRYHLVAAARGACPAAEASPVVHEATALLEQVTAPVCRLDLVGDNMPKRGLRNLARIVGRLRTPVLERAAEAVRHIAETHFAHQFEHRH